MERARFTHVDPFEDTESSGSSTYGMLGHPSFTHVDPFEDTERRLHQCIVVLLGQVSPTSIRSRILKGHTRPLLSRAVIVSPTSIRSRILKGIPRTMVMAVSTSFTHVDPFEDTESWFWLRSGGFWFKFHPRRSVRGY